MVTLRSISLFAIRRDRAPVALLLLLLAAVCTTRASAGSSGPFEVRAMRSPIFVSVELPAAEHLMALSEEARAAQQEQIAAQIVAAAQQSPQRLLILNLLPSSWRFDLLDEGIRSQLTNAYGEGAGAHFESSVAIFLAGALARVDRAVPGTPLSIYGLPAEPGGLSEAGAQELNGRFAPVVRRLSALASNRAFIIYGREQNEFHRVRPRLSEATRLHAGRPIIFRTSGKWRMALPLGASDSTTSAELGSASDDPGIADVRARDQRQAFAGDGAPLGDSADMPTGNLTESGSDGLAAGSGGGGGDAGGGSPPGGGDNPGTPPPDCDDPDYDPWNHVHDFTGLPMTCDGWTDFAAMFRHPDYYDDSRIIYVSSSTGEDTSGVTYPTNHPYVGSDPFEPANPRAIKPYRSIAAAYNQVRNGFPDVVLFRRGDTWEGGMGSWSKSGRSIEEPQILATYGTSLKRPTFRSGGSAGITTSGTDFLVVSGIRFYAHNWQSGSPGKGVDMLSGGTGSRYQLHEDCVYERSDLIRVQGSWNNGQAHERIAFRRCVMIDTGPKDGSSQTFYVQDAVDVLFEENLFHTPNTNSRWLYLSPEGNADKTSLRGVVVRGNTFYCAGETGISARAGGLIENNLIVQNDLIFFGGKGGSAGSIQSGVIRNNVILDSTSPGAGDGEWGITLSDIDGGQVYGNVIAGSESLGAFAIAIFLRGEHLGIARNVDIHRNIVYGRKGEYLIRVANELSSVANVKVRQNDLQAITGVSRVIGHSSAVGFAGFTFTGNRYFSSTNANSWFFQGNLPSWIAASGDTGSSAIVAPYPDAVRSIATYHSTLGGDSSVEAYMSEALKQSRKTWRPEYTAEAVNAYIRAGFELPPDGVVDH